MKITKQRLKEIIKEELAEADIASIRADLERPPGEPRHPEPEPRPEGPPRISRDPGRPVGPGKPGAPRPGPVRAKPQKT